MSIPPERGALLVMAKAPEPGRVKTRLAAEVGPERAAELARAFLVDTWKNVSRVEGMEPILVLEGDAPLPDLDPIPEIWSQGEGDLGARMGRAIRRALTRFPFAICVGTDSPNVPLEYVERAVEAMNRGADSVLGPTDDGGYYLIGLKRCPMRLFANLPWSTPDTYAATLARLETEEYAPWVVDRWFDVDEADDLERLRDTLCANRDSAPETAGLVCDTPDS